MLKIGRYGGSCVGEDLVYPDKLVSGLAALTQMVAEQLRLLRALSCWISRCTRSIACNHVLIFVLIMYNSALYVSD